MLILSSFMALLGQISAQQGGGTPGTIAGRVTDAESGAGLPGANVFLKSTNLGAAADLEGDFIIRNVVPGRYEMSVTYLGYETVNLEVVLGPGEDQRRDIELQVQSVALEAVKVTGERYERQQNNQISRISLDMRQLKSVPQIGEADLLRTLQALPGVLTQAEFSTGLVVRGGNTDQNLILLDGITVYNPSHLGGLFSNFILDAVEEADLIKGGFNAEYGDRLSAVLDIRSREGNRDRFDAKVSISLLSAQSTLEGPLGRGAWLVSGRRTYFDQVFKATDLYFPYYFYDVQGYVFQDLTSTDRLSLSWYQGRDKLQWGDFGLLASWGNQTMSANYRKLLGTKVVTKLMLATSRFDTRFRLGGDPGLLTVNRVEDLTVRSDWTILPSDDTQIRFGGEVKDLSFKYTSTFFDTLSNLAQAPLETALYAKVKRWITPRLMFEPGLRTVRYSLHPEQWFLEPRLGMKIILTSDRYINAAVGYYHQFLETVQDDFNPAIIDQWFAVDETVAPATAVQAVLGYEEYFGEYRFQFEGYAKLLDNLLTFVDRRATTDQSVESETLEDLFEVSSGYAYGVEVFLQKSTGRLNGWAAYTYSHVRKRLGDKEYFANWDRRHAVNVIGNYRINQKWDFNLNWTYQSGQPYTPILGYYVESFPNEPEPFYRSLPGGRNAARYPAYHRLDLGAVRHFKVGRITVDLFLQVVNAYWRKNVFRYIYQFGSTNNGVDDDNDGSTDELDEGIPRKEPISIFPILPSLGFTIEF
ncbi:carboxypeptidase-like regulatory domain-containing protein [Candidatus Neomarinimicrobiota bacterium]